MARYTKVSTFSIQLFIMMMVNMGTLTLFAEEELPDIEYIPIEPVIVTNYQKKSTRKPGFIQIKAQLSVRGKESVELVSKHMPLIRDYIINHLSFTSETIIQDVSKRKELRTSIATGIQDLLSEAIGQPHIEELMITHYMWD